MAWERITWHEYPLHLVRGNPPIRDIVESTRNGRKAKYKPGVNVQAIELSAFSDAGIFIFEAKAVRVFYVIEPCAIGWDNGIETNIARVEWGGSPPGPVHGRPFNEHNVMEELRIWDKSLRKCFKQNKHIFRLGEQMQFVDWQKILPRYWAADVIFSYLAYPPDEDTITSNPVGIRLPGDMLIDVEWDGRTRRYQISLFAENQSAPLTVLRCKTVDQVIAAVMRLGEVARRRYLTVNPTNMSLSSIFRPRNDVHSIFHNVSSHSPVITVPGKTRPNAVIQFEACSNA